MLHLVMELEDGAVGKIADERLVYNTLLEAVGATGSLVCQSVRHERHPIGFSAAVLMAESHATIHTWPSYALEDGKGGALVDYFTGSKTPRANLFVAAWEAAGYVVKRQQIVPRLEEEE